MIGYAFMGAAHSQGWRVAPRFFDLALSPEMTVVAGRNGPAVKAAAHKLGWSDYDTDWRRVLDRDDVDLVDICTPGDSHAEIAIAALAAGKHVLCEKPLANTVAEAEEMAAAASEAAERGVFAMVGFTYRRVPAIALARQLVAEGRVGTLRHVRAQYLQDWIADQAAPLSWRLERSRAGSGALGDIGAHIIDLTQFITGERITGVSGLLETFVHERPVASEFVGLRGSASTERGPVTVDDAAVFTARFAGGAVGTFEATRFAWGRKNAIRVEINGSAGFRRIVVTEPEHPYIGAWWPAGHGLGYEHAFVHQVVDLVGALAAGEQPTPSFADGLAIQRVLDAVERSAEDQSRWTTVPTDEMEN